MTFEDRLRNAVRRACGHNDNFKARNVFKNDTRDYAYKITVYVPVMADRSAGGSLKNTPHQATGAVNRRPGHDEPAYLTRRRALLASLPPYAYWT